MIAFFPRAHKLHLYPVILEHGRPKVLEHAHPRMALFADLLCQQNPRTYLSVMPGYTSVMPGYTSVMPGLTGYLHDDVNIFIGAPQKAIPHIPPNHKRPHAQFPGRFTHKVEHRMLQISFRNRHNISSHSGACCINCQPSAVRSKMNVLRPFVIAIYLTFNSLLYRRA